MATTRKLQNSAILDVFVLIVFIALTPMPSHASMDGGIAMEILINGSPIAEHLARGTTYIEASEGAEYAVRIRNTTRSRIAVALAVDGLNSIDAKTTSARRASKWVLGPYETVVIEGWQTDQRHARKFFFTSEDRSYGSWLGETANLGVIEAVAFRERVAPRDIADSTGRARRQSPSAAEASPAPPSCGKDADAGRLSDEIAATGIGRRVDHSVRQVRLDLESDPIAHLRIRYEYRPQLVALGVLPPLGRPMDRREQARGFTDLEFCPDPNAGR